jgi:hypothetical protein
MKKLRRLSLSYKSNTIFEKIYIAEDFDYTSILGLN